MKIKCSLYPEKLLLMLSGAAFLMLIAPAWVSGFLWCGIWAVLLWGVTTVLPVTQQRVRQLLKNPAHQMLGLVVCSALGCNFYNTWLDSRYVERIAGILGAQIEPFLFVCAAVMALAAMPAAGCVLSYYITAAREDFRSKNALPGREKGLPLGKAFWILFVVYAIGISAVLRADFLYRDDFGREAFGYKHWDYFSRYLSTAMATLVHMNDQLVDIAPLPQLLAMGIMALSGMATAYIVYERKAISWWELLVLVPLGLNPYFLECISYRFDAPYMAVSVLCGVFPLLFRKRNSVAYVFASMMGTLMVCTSYQAATGVFPMLVIFLALRLLHRGEPFREVFVFCLKSVVGYGLGLVFFKLAIMKPADAGYVTNALPGLTELIPNTLNNLKRYYLLISSDFKTIWLVLTVLGVAVFPVVSASGSKLKKLPALALSLLGLVLMGLLCFGIYPVLADTIFAPRAMYGFGVLIALLGLAAAEDGKQVLFSVPVLVLGWAFFVFSFHYGNVLSIQKEYTDFRVNLVIEDLNDLEIFQTGEEVTVQLTGNIGKAPILKNLPQDNGILDRLLPDTFGGVDDWTQYGFYYYYGLKNVAWDRETDLTGKDLPVLEERMYHTIYGADNLVLIELK